MVIVIPCYTLDVKALYLQTALALLLLLELERKNVNDISIHQGKETLNTVK